MPEITQCPECQRKLNVPDGQIGATVRCPACGHEFNAQPYVAPRSIPVTPEPPPPREPPPRSGPRRGGNYPPPPAYDEDYGRPPPRPRYDRDYGRGYGRGYGGGYPHRGSSVQTMGIISICLFWFPIACWILGIIALVMASTDLGQMEAGQMDPSGRSATKAGLICAIIGIGLSLLFVFSCCGLSIMGRAGFYGW